LAAGPPAVIRLSAAPEVVLADGQSKSTIRADVRDAEGAAVADGTPVSFQTTLGTIDPLAETVGGIAQVSLLSPLVAGHATVTAVAGSAVGSTSVEFAIEAAAREEVSVVEVQGEWIAYYPQADILEAIGQARLSYRGVEIRAAGSILLQSRRLEFSAFEATLRSGDKEIAGYYLQGRFTAASVEGIAVQVGEQVRAVAFRGSGLTIYNEDVPVPEARLKPPEPSYQMFWLKARTVLLFPEDKIAFRRAEFWSGPQKLFTVPNYLLHLSPAGQARDQFISLSSIGGIGVDFPFYYHVDKWGAGALRLQRSRNVDWGAPRQGWSLALEEEYRPTRNIDGGIVIDGLTREDWGVRWSHHQTLDPAREAYVYMGYPSHRYFYLNGNVYERTDKGTISTVANYAQAVGGPASYGVETSVRLFSQPIPGTDWRYYASGSLGLSRDVTLGQMVVSQGVSLSVYPQSWPLGKNVRGSFQADYNFRWDTAGRAVTTVRARVGANRRLGRAGTASLGYQWECIKGDSARAGTHRQVNGMAMFGFGSPVFGSVSLNYDPEYDSLSAYGDVSWRAHAKWRFNLRSAYQSTSYFDQADHQISALYRLGSQEAALRWSSLRHRFWLELVGAQF